MDMKSTSQASFSGKTCDALITEAIEKKIFVQIYLINGIKLEGYIADFDAHTFFLNNFAPDIPQMIYKHAISTIVLQPNDNTSKDNRVKKGYSSRYKA
jgi:host factor-I protein